MKKHKIIELEGNTTKFEDGVPDGNATLTERIGDVMKGEEFPGTDLELLLKFEQADKKGKSIILEQEYQAALSTLREKFPSISEDLSNKKINIRYKKENGEYCNLFLSNGCISFPGETVLSIRKIGDSWDILGHTGMLQMIEAVALKRFILRVEDFINHANECELKIE